MIEQKEMFANDDTEKKVVRGNKKFLIYEKKSKLKGNRKQDNK